MNKKDNLTIITKTTGFSSPARDYVTKRLDTNDLLIDDPYSTFFFEWSGKEILGLSKNDYLVVNKAALPQSNDLVIYNDSDKLSVDLYKNINPDNLWGVITWKLCKLKK